MSTLDEGLDELVTDLKWARAEENGEVETMPRGVWIVNDDDQMEYIGSTDEVTDQIAQAFERGYAGQDPSDYEYEEYE